MTGDDVVGSLVGFTVVTVFEAFFAVCFAFSLAFSRFSRRAAAGRFWSTRNAPHANIQSRLLPTKRLIRLLRVTVQLSASSPRFRESVDIIASGVLGRKRLEDCHRKAVSIFK